MNYDDGYPMSTDRVPRRITVLRGRYRRTRQPVDRDDFQSDTAGSPSESRCSETHLANILAARDEAEAAKLKTVPRQ